MGNASGKEEGADQSQGRSAEHLPERLQAGSPTRSPTPHQHPVAREDVGVEGDYPPQKLIPTLITWTQGGDNVRDFPPQKPIPTLITWTQGGDNVRDSPPQKLIPTLITWTQGGDNVAVQGSWDNWESRKVLERAGKDHSLFLVLPYGIFHYRFIVDGETRPSPDLPFVSDEMGNVCHVLDVHDYVPEILDGVSQFEVPGSPDSSYDQDFPEEDDFSREPVLVPSQLHMSVLDVPKVEDTSSKPQHVVLNHLYMEKGWASESVVGLGMTHRFESKYVTVVLYKPLKR